MSQKTLLVVLGHQNSPAGVLTETARLRCLRAAAIIKEQVVDHVLVTGAFGENFNTSSAPHANHMITTIKQSLTKSQNNIEFHQTASAFTEEDIYAARRIAIDLVIDKIIFVTSEFHMDRVKQIAKYIFRDRAVLFDTATNGTDVSKHTRRREKHRLVSFEKGWVDAPLYSKKNDPFPVEIYQDARQEHKHDDTISLSIITASFIIAVYPYAKRGETYMVDNINAVQINLICSVISFLLFILYFRFAHFAYIGRRLMCAIELSWGLPGSSYNHARFVYSKWRLSKRFGTMAILAMIVFSIIILNLTTSALFITQFFL